MKKNTPSTILASVTSLSYYVLLSEAYCLQFFCRDVCFMFGFGVSL